MTEEAGSSMSANVDELENSGQGVDPGSGDESRAAEESNGAAPTDSESESESPSEVSASADAGNVSDPDDAADADDADEADEADEAAERSEVDGPGSSAVPEDSDAPSDVDLDSDADSDADSDEDDGDSEEDSEDSDESDPEESEAERVSRLEQEGDVAADYLEELLDIADIDGDIDLDIESDRALVAIVGGRLHRLVGRDGEVLEALQELARLAVLRETGVRSRLMLDIDGHRARRRGELVGLAEKVAAQVKETGKPVKLDPMSPFERKIVHDTVAAKGLTSESEGEEPERRVVVQPA